MLQSGQKNGLLFATWLVEHGYSRQLLSRYRSSGWLSSLCKGVMYRTGDTLSAFGALQSFNEQVGKSFRVAAHSALELWGFNHYVPMGKPLLMVSTASDKMPQWMKHDIFDREFKFFKTEVFISAQITTLTYLDWRLLISSPEQAFMECLLLTPRQYNYMDKMKRLFLYMAEKAGHYWYEDLDLTKIDLGTHKLQLAKSGIYISKYKMIIPKELNDYE